MCSGLREASLWSDYYAIPKGAPHMEAAYALINFHAGSGGECQARCWHMAIRQPTAHTNACCPRRLLNDPILYPAAEELLNALEFGAAVTLTDPNRAELMARFKSA